MTESVDNVLDSLWRDAAYGGGESPSALSQLLQESGPEEAARQIVAWLQRVRRTTCEASVVATGLGWLGGGIRSVEQAMLSLIPNASREILVTAYSLTGGSSRVTDALGRAAAAGVRCVIVVNRLDDQSPAARATLRQLAERHRSSVRVYDFSSEGGEGLHAKAVVIDREVAVIGSANLTFHGLSASHELGVVLRGAVAELVGEAVDRLLASPNVHPA